MKVRYRHHQLCRGFLSLSLIPKVPYQLKFCLAELNNLRKNLFIRFIFCLGRRQAGEKLPTSQLPPLPEKSFSHESRLILLQEQTNSLASPEIKDFQRSPGYRYPAIEIFRTREETHAQLSRRDSNVGEVPELVVQKTSRMMRAPTRVDDVSVG
jgi:hypothetical protein